MTRNDIENYLDLALETVSRVIGILVKQDIFLRRSQASNY